MSNSQHTTAAVGYQRALDDYAIADVLQKVSESVPQLLSDQEASRMAALLIAQLPETLTPGLLSCYQRALRYEQQQQASCRTLELKLPQSTEPPSRSQVPPPLYHYGDRIRLVPVEGDDSEWGRVMGNYLGYRHCHWSWCYLLWLDADSTSARWLSVSWAWEAEVEGIIQKNQ